MAKKNFISLSNLSLYDELIKTYVNSADAKSIKAAALNGKKLNLYTIENPTVTDIPKYSITLPFVEREIQGQNGKALVFNESDGGGAKFEHKDGTMSFAGVNDGGENGLTGQLYTLKKDANGKNVGTRLNMTLNGFYYTNGANSSAFSSENEIATLGDISTSSADKTIYTTESSGGPSDNYSKKYSFYQGSNGSSVSPDPLEKVTDIFIPKDMIISAGSVVDIVFANNKLWDGQDDVTEIIKGSETPTAADAGKYIKLIVANTTDGRIYIKASDLVDVYTGGTTSETSVSIDNTNEITVGLVDNGIIKNKLSSTLQTSIDAADSALQPEDVDSVDDADIRALFD